MEFAFLHSPIWLLLIVPIAAGAAWWMYRKTSELLPRIPRYLLTGFRFLIFVLLGTLLLEPLLNYIQRMSSPPIVAVLQDVSESLVIQQDSQFVKEEYPGLLGDFVGDFDGEDYMMDLWGYASQLFPIEHSDSLSFTSEGTNISLALEEVQKKYQNQNLGALVLISDGISTAGINPLYTTEQIRQPVFTVLLGDTTQQRDLQIQDVLYNEIAYLKSEMPIKVKVNILGYPLQDIQVTLNKDDAVIDRKTIQLGGTKQSEDVDFYFQPEETGLQRYTIRLTALDNEISYKNNVKRIFVNVLETRRKIAIFAGGPHPDIGALRRTFDTDESYEVEPFILKQPGEYYQDPFTKDLAAYDLIILHNFPESSRDVSMVERLVEVVKNENKPLMVFIGKSTDLKVMEPLYPYMAITPEEIKFRSEEIITNFLSTYQQHSTYTFGRNWLDWAGASPPIYHNRSSWKPKQTAEVFATAKIKNVELDYPVFALQNYLSRKNMVFIGENFWRMRTHSYIERETFDAFDDWIINNVKWLTVTDDKRKFKVEPTKNIFTGNEPVILKGQVYDDSYNPIPNVDIKISMRNPSGKINDYYLNEIAPSQYISQLYNLAEGTYNYEAEGILADRVVGRDKGTFSIGRSNIEHFQLQANDDLMQQIALRTGGEFVYARDLNEVAEKLRNLSGLKPLIDYKTQRQSIINFPWLLILVLIFLSVEWTVRKWHSML